jgi:hypothetical protein
MRAMRRGPWARLWARDLELLLSLRRICKMKSCESASRGKRRTRSDDEARPSIVLDMASVCVCTKRIKPWTGALQIIWPICRMCSKALKDWLSPYSRVRDTMFL